MIQDGDVDDISILLRFEVLSMIRHLFSISLWFIFPVKEILFNVYFLMFLFISSLLTKLKIRVQ